MDPELLGNYAAMVARARQRANAQDQAGRARFAQSRPVAPVPSNGVRVPVIPRAEMQEVIDGLILQRRLPAGYKL